MSHTISEWTKKELKQELSTLRHQLADEQEARAKAQTALEEYEEKVSIYLKDLVWAYEQRDALTTRLQAAEAELDNLKCENTRAQGTISRLEKDEGTLKNMVDLAVKQRDKAMKRSE